MLPKSARNFRFDFRFDQRCFTPSDSDIFAGPWLKAAAVQSGFDFVRRWGSKWGPKYLYMDGFRGSVTNKCN
jgi:hypothetical protein